jgi:hypothetical protein
MTREIIWSDEDGKGRSMRLLSFIAGLSFFMQAANAAPSPDHFFEKLVALSGSWQAELPGYGMISNSIRLISNGKAIEETIGAPADNETSFYTKDRDRLLLTHICALTPDGHIVRLESGPVGKDMKSLSFDFQDSTNLQSHKAPHMRHVVLKIKDHDHFEEIWTKTENGKDTIFDLNFVRE